MNKRIVINMISSADMVAGQGVGSAYEEQVQLVKEGASDIFDVRVNEHCKSDINHFHTIDPVFYVKMKTSKADNLKTVISFLVRRITSESSTETDCVLPSHREIQ